MPDKRKLVGVSAADEAWTNGDIRSAVLSFLDDFSIEATPHTIVEVDSYLEYLSPGTTIYVAHPPNTSLDDVVQMATRLRELGYTPVPHLIARKLRSQAELDSALGQMHDFGIDEILIVAGDLMQPLGPFGNTMELLQTGLLLQHGFKTVGIAGHPEGSRAIGPTMLHRALCDKAQFAADTGLQVYIVTQFGFNAQAVIDWETELSTLGIELPIHVGMAGPTSLKQLLRYAMRCGINASMRMFVGKATAISEHLKLTPVDEMVPAFARHRLSHPDCRMIRAHFYALGGAERTARWLNAIRSGKFEMNNDHLKIELAG
jgi:methylenetetrahydrofolate reductase (NADPH)